MEKALMQILLSLFKQFVTPELVKMGETAALQWVYDQAKASSKPEVAEFVKVLADDLGVTVV